MANRKKKLTRLTISVDPDDYAGMEERAEASGFFTSWTIRQAMRGFWKNMKKGSTSTLP